MRLTSLGKGVVCFALGLSIGSLATTGQASDSGAATLDAHHHCVFVPAVGPHAEGWDVGSHVDGWNVLSVD
jgi:hypothetical protein